MKNSKITNEQIKKMHDYLSKIPITDKGNKNDLKLFYSALTPKDVYVKYVSYSLNGDNSISSNITLIRINPNGSTTNMLDELKELKYILEFESDLIEVDLDANGNIVFV
jgi:hypothetical protein